jgi:hypothetical protein
VKVVDDGSEYIGLTVIHETAKLGIPGWALFELPALTGLRAMMALVEQQTPVSALGLSPWATIPTKSLFTHPRKQYSMGEALRLNSVEEEQLLAIYWTNPLQLSYAIIDTCGCRVGN